MKTNTERFMIGLLGSALVAPALHAADFPAVTSTNAAVTTSATNEMAAAETATPLEAFWAQDRILGDWFGARTNLAKRGITADLRLSQYWQGVASGGVQQRGDYGGTMDYIVEIDGDKLAGMKGFSMNMHARTRFGSDINSSAGSFVLPNAGMLMPLPGDYNGTDITGLTAAQMFPLFNKPTIVSFGKLDLIDTLTGLFPWIADGQEGLMNVNAMFPVLPMFGPIEGLSLFGGVAMNIHPEYGMPQSGLLVTGTENVTTTWDFAGSFEDGVFMAGFHRFFWGKPTDKLGHFTIMAYGSTKDQASNDRHDFVFIPGQGIVSTAQKKPWGVAGFLYQDFWHAKGDPNRKANFAIGGSGGKRHVHRRYLCSKFQRQGWHEYAKESVLWCRWAAAYYWQQREKGLLHDTAVRALAYKWQRVIWRCWQDRTVYDDARYEAVLRRRNSPLVKRFDQIELGKSPWKTAQKKLNKSLA